MDLQLIPLENLDEPTNPSRTLFDTQALSDLAASIKTQGLIEPLIVKPTDAPRYEVVAGHRRLLACRLAPLALVPCIIREGDTGQLAALTFAENSHRENLTPWEEAKEVKRAVAVAGGGYTVLARLFNRSPAWIASRLALFDYPEDLQALVRTQQLSLAHAAALARVSDAQHRQYLASYAMLSGANARTIDAWVQAWEAEAAAGDAAGAPKPLMTDRVQTPVLLLTCDTCGQQHDSQAMRLLRVCLECASHLQT